MMILPRPDCIVLEYYYVYCGPKVGRNMLELWYWAVSRFGTAEREMKEISSTC